MSFFDQWEKQFRYSKMAHFGLSHFGMKMCSFEKYATFSEKSKWLIRKFGVEWILSVKFRGRSGRAEGGVTAPGLT